MHRLPESLFVLSLRQDHFSKSTIKLLGRTPPFLYLKKGCFQSNSTKTTLQKPVRARLRERYAPNSRKNVCSEPKASPFQRLNNKFVRSHSVFIFKTNNIFSQIQPKRPSQRPVAAHFRDTYAPTCRKYVCTNPKRRLFQ